MSGAELSTGGLLQQRPFVMFWLSRIAATIGYQMMALLIGWKVYEITGSAFDLGLVGLMRWLVQRHRSRYGLVNGFQAM